MSTTPTLAAPTETQQINTFLYVGVGALHTIQQAVNFAVATGGGFHVIIPPGYAGSEPISSIVGGTSTITLADRRIAQAQNYSWNGTNYVPAGIHEMGNAQVDLILTAGSLRATDDFEQGQPDSVQVCYNYTSGHGIFLATGPDVPTVAPLLLTGWNSDHTQAINYLECTPTGCAFDTDVAVVGTLTAPTATITTLTAPDATIDDLTATDATIDDLTATDALFTTCEVANSPVRTLANTPDALPLTGGTLTGPLTLHADPTGALDAATKQYVDSHVGGGGGMIFPEAGIAVSTGTAWATSLDPANSFLPLTPLANTVVNTAAGNLTIAGSAAGTSGSSIYLGATNTADSVVIRPGGYGPTLQWRNALQTNGDLNNIYTNYGSGDFYTGAGSPNAPPQLTGSPAWMSYFAHAGDGDNQLQTVWNYQEAPSIMQVLSRYKGPGGWTSWVEMLHDDGAGNMTIAGRINAGTASFTFNSYQGIATPDEGLTIGWNVTNSNGETDFINTAPVPGGGGGFAWYNVAEGVTVTASTPTAMVLDSNDNLTVQGSVSAPDLFASVGLSTPEITVANSDGTVGTVYLAGGVQVVGSTGGNLAINGAGPGSVLLNWEGGADGIVFGNGNTVSVGGVTATGVLTAITKSFQIPHPLDDTKNLTHSCIEGPEIAVFYRGEGMTQNGFTTISLPDYFESLTRPEGRTVLLTPLFEDDNESFGMVAAGRVHEGKFRVRSDNPSQRFYWEVKAIRADVNELEVETAKVEAKPTPLPHPIGVK
jgi:hypothetical protein